MFNLFRRSKFEVLENLETSEKAWGHAKKFQDVLSMSKAHIEDPKRHKYVPYDLGIEDIDNNELKHWRKDLLSLHDFGILPSGIGEFSPGITENDWRRPTMARFESISFIMADDRKQQRCRTLLSILEENSDLVVRAFRRGSPGSKNYFHKIFQDDHLQSPAMVNEDLWWFEMATIASQRRSRRGPRVNMAHIVLKAAQDSVVKDGLK